MIFDNDWCKIMHIDGVLVLFQKDFDIDHDGKDLFFIRASVKTDERITEIGIAYFEIADREEHWENDLDMISLGQKAIDSGKAELPF